MCRVPYTPQRQDHGVEDREGPTAGGPSRSTIHWSTGPTRDFAARDAPDRHCAPTLRGGQGDQRLVLVVHEWCQLRSVWPDCGNVDAAVRAMTSYYGGSGLTGAELTADCMAIARGATWTTYTSCPDSRWRAGADRLLKREQL